MPNGRPFLANIACKSRIRTIIYTLTTATNFNAAALKQNKNAGGTSLQKLVLKRERLRGAWRDRDTNDIFAHCSLIFYFLDFKFSNFVCPSVLHRLIWFFLKNAFRKKKNIRKTTQNALAPSIFIVLSMALKLSTPLLHTQAQNTLLQIF